MNDIEKNKIIRNIYNSFVVKLNILKSKQLNYLKKLFASKQERELEDLRKDIQG